jgi:hypothetical protein
MENIEIKRYRVMEINNLVCVSDVDSMLYYISKLNEKNLNYDEIVFQFKLYCIQNNFNKINEIMNLKIIGNENIMYIIERLCYYNNIESIKIIINQLDNNEKNSIFLKCCQNYNNDSINYLSKTIDLNIIDKNLLFRNLCISGNINLLQKFINNNKNELEYNKNLYLISSIKSSNIELIKWFIDNYEYDDDALYNAFYSSCFYGNLDIIKLFTVVNIDNSFINNLYNDWYDQGIQVRHDVINILNDRMDR